MKYLSKKNSGWSDRTYWPAKWDQLLVHTREMKRQNWSNTTN